MNNYIESNINRLSNSDAEINYQCVPFDKDFNYKLTNKSNPFSDKGAWFSYYFPIKKEMSFYGPNVISQEIPVNIGKYVSNSQIIVNNKPIKKFNEFNLVEKDGFLTINAKYQSSLYTLKIKKTLFFVNEEDALISFDIDVKTNIDLKVEIVNKLCLYKKIKYKSTNNEDDKSSWENYLNSITNQKNKIKLTFNPLINKNINETFEISFDKNVKLINEYDVNNEIFKEYLIDKTLVKKNESKTITCNWYESFFFNKKKKSISFEKNKIDELKKKSINEWKKYKQHFKSFSQKDKNVAYKSIYTLIGNWLRPNGVIKNSIIIPSRTYSDFIGAYAWDTFKIAYGLCEFKPQLAQEIINSIFDHQIKKSDSLRPQDEGMIPDCIYFNYNKDRNGVGTNWNERNTKPPLASWGAWNVYKKTKDINWLKKIYPKLKLFQEWWLKTRKLDSSIFFLSYGATIDKNNNIKDPKSILEAISWESGMDNAPRFDWDRMKILIKEDKNKKKIGYITDQASLCLNVFFYLDLVYFNKIHNEIFKIKNKNITNMSKELKNNINKYMYSDKTGFYHEIKINDLKPIENNGLSIEMFLPMYAKIVPMEKSKKMISKIDKLNFLTPFPFPTVAANNERFDPTNYWRGPVWISFLYFAIIGIYNYDKSKAIKEKTKVIDILDSKEFKNQPLRENYHPITKQGLATTNFSWTASLLISLIKEVKK